MSRPRDRIVIDLRHWVETRKVYGDGLLYEALVELLDPAPSATTLLGKTHEEWFALPLRIAERALVDDSFRSRRYAEANLDALVAVQSEAQLRRLREA